VQLEGKRRVLTGAACSTGASDITTSVGGSTRLAVAAMLISYDGDADDIVSAGVVDKSGCLIKVIVARGTGSRTFPRVVGVGSGKGKGQHGIAFLKEFCVLK
jgi:hypothetical protein